MFSLWFLIFLVLFAVKNVYCTFQNRLLYGSVVNPSLFDWSVVQIKYIRKDGTTGLCTGTMISKRHLLTAMHCVKDQKMRTHRNLTFNVVNDKQEFDIHIRSEHVDIAIIEFEKNTTFLNKNMSRILLSGDYMNGINYQNQINQTGIIAGYGYHDYEYSNQHRAQVGVHDGKLRAGKVPLWPSGWCFGIRSKICTSDYYPVAVEGDSGGPLLFQQTYYENARLVTKNYQFGIVIQTQDTSKWNLAVPIYSQCGWIEKTTKGAAKCKYVFPKNLDIINRRSRSTTPSPSLLSLKKESSNVQHFKDEKSVISDSNILLASENDISKPLRNLPKNELKEEEYKEIMDAVDLFCILNCINILVLFCLAVLLCYYFCFKGERNVELPTAVQKV